MNELKLSKSIYVNGAEVGALPYDFEAMTAADRLAVSRDMNAHGFALATAEEFDPAYHLFLFAKAVEVATRARDEQGRIAASDILRIQARDARKAGELARDFFYLSE